MVVQLTAWNLEISLSNLGKRGVGIDVPIVGDLFHITFKYLLEMKYPLFSWVILNWDIYQPLFTDHLEEWRLVMVTVIVSKWLYDSNYF